MAYAGFSVRNFGNSRNTAPNSLREKSIGLNTEIEKLQAHGANLCIRLTAFLKSCSNVVVPQFLTQDLWISVGKEAAKDYVVSANEAVSSLRESNQLITNALDAIDELESKKILVGVVGQTTKLSSDEALSSSSYVVQVCNFDESGICPLSPTHQYLPANTTRGIEIGADKARITGCITVNAAGKVLPCMFIMKHSTAKVYILDRDPLVQETFLL